MYPLMIITAILQSVGVCVGGMVQQHRYLVFQENLTIDSFNPMLADINSTVFKLNDTTNAVNIFVVFKHRFGDDSRAYATAFRSSQGDNYKQVLKISKTIKGALEMDMFDLDSLFLRSFKPPMVWPLEPGVTYHAIGWSPDSTKFPPTLPVGRWRVPIDITLGNKTRIVLMTWHLRTFIKK